MSYRIECLENVVREDISRLSKAVRNRIRRAIEQKLASHSVEFGKPLRYSLKGAHRLRMEDWRIVYTMEPPDVVLIVKIGHRKEVYEM